MAGKKGMPMPIHVITARQKMWQTIRIKRRGFNIWDLLLTVPEASRHNAQKLLRRLVLHGIICEVGQYVGGRPGEFKGYRLRHDAGPKLPRICPYCNGLMTANECREAAK